jgi:hypothetical protein
MTATIRKLKNVSDERLRLLSADGVMSWRRRMVRIPVGLPAEHYRQLARHALENNTSMSALLRGMALKLLSDCE